jgi:hypothetical protein
MFNKEDFIFNKLNKANDSNSLQYWFDIHGDVCDKRATSAVMVYVDPDIHGDVYPDQWQLVFDGYDKSGKPASLLVDVLPKDIENKLKEYLLKVISDELQDVVPNIIYPTEELKRLYGELE